MRTLWMIVMIDVKYVAEKLEKWLKEGLDALGVNSGWTGLVFV